MHRHFRDIPTISNCRSFGCVFTEPDLFDNNVPFDDNTTPIYLINMLWKLGLGLRLHFLELHYIRIFHRE